MRSYGWSANAPCSFATNFEQLVIFDCRFKPKRSHGVSVNSIKLHISKYINNFDLLFDHLFKDNVKSNKLEELYATKSVEDKENLDFNFNTMLAAFRIRLANNLLENNSSFANNIAMLNYYVQVILDRIIFIRVWESRGIEKKRKIKRF